MIALAWQRFGRLLVLERGENTVQGKSQWMCRCDCGRIKQISAAHLRSGETVSCGCWRRELAVEKGRASRYVNGHAGVKSRLVHGHAGAGRPTAEYMTWQSMIQRCYSPKKKGFKYYGGRGITVCERWHVPRGKGVTNAGFLNFFADMGERPPGLSLDRIDNNGNYEAANCRWATRSEQMGNRRPWLRTRGKIGA